MAKRYTINVENLPQIQIENGKLGLYGKDPVGPIDFIRDADGTLADITTKFNAMLAGLTLRGDMQPNLGDLITKTIGAGKDYATLTEWQADNYGCQANDRAVAKVYGAITQAPITLTNTTPQSIIIEAADGEKHTGVPGTGARFVSSGTGILLSINTGSVPVIVRDLEFNHNSKNITSSTLNITNAANGTFERCLVYGSSSSIAGSVYGILINGPGITRATIENCIVCNLTANNNGGTLYGIFCNLNGILRVYNNTVAKLNNAHAAGNTTGIYMGEWTNIYYRNNLVAGITASGGGTAKCYGTTESTAPLHSHNLGTDATSPDEDFRDKTIAFADYSGSDYHLAGTDTDAIGMGAGPDLDSNIPTDDIDGDSRSGPSTDIGADQYVA